MGALLGGLDALLAASGLVLAVLVGSLILRPLLVAVLAQAPFIGGWLASNVDSGLARFQAAISPLAQSSAGLLADMFYWLADAGGSLLAALASLPAETAAALGRLKSLDLPALEARVDGFAAGAAAEVHRLLSGALGAAVAGLEAAVAAARAAAAGLFQAAQAEALSLEAKAEAEAEALVAAARAEAVELVEQARAEAAAGLGEAEALARDLAAAEREAMLAAVGLAERDLQALARAEGVALRDSVSLLGGDLAAAEARAEAALAGLDASLQRSIEGILASLPWQSLAATAGAGEAVLQADVKTLVALGAQEIRKAMGDAEALRAKYGPQVRAALAQVGSLK